MPDQYPFNQVEDIGDKLTMIAQQLTDVTSRSLKISVSKSADIDATIPWENGKSFRISDDGAKIELTEDPARVLPLAQGVYAQAQAQAQSASASAANAKNYSENVNVFIPSVSSAGVLSWTNKAGLANPASVNIKGAKGDKGDTGTAATIKVGTVTTGAAGSAASVVNRGDVNNAILDFVLPKGADGKGAVITVNGKEPDAGGNVNVKEYTHPNSGVTAGTYRSVTVNAQGHVTAGSNPTLAIANGGTGANNASDACANIGAFPLSGGALTGNKISLNKTNDVFWLFGGTNVYDGANIALCGKDSTNYENTFIIRTTDACQLFGKPDGTLKWNNKDIARADMNDYVIAQYTDPNNNFYRVWQSGLVEQGGIVTPTSYWATITLFKAMADTNFHVIVSLKYNGDIPDKNYCVYAYPITNNTFNVYQDGYPSKDSTIYPIMWYAYGKGA